MRRPKPVTDAPARSIEVDLAGLTTTRANLESRQQALAAELERAVAARRELLIGGSDAAAISGAERTCRELEGTALGVADALAEIGRRIAAAEGRIAEARAAAERETAATMLERDGNTIDAAAERVRRAVEDLVKAGAALADAITPTSAPFFSKRDMHGLRNNEPPERIAAYLVGHTIAAAMPALNVAEAGRQERFGWVSPEPIAPVDGDEPARALMTEPMRSMAALIRAGDASPYLARFERPEPNFEPDREEVQVYVVETFTYLRKTGYVPEIVSVRQQSLPMPLAELAIERGLAFEAEPANYESLKRRASAGGRAQDIFELPAIGFNLEEWRAAETKRRRDAWLAEQREAA